MKTATPLYGPIGITPPVLLKAQGPSALNVIQSSNYVVELDHPENKTFRDAYKKKFNEDPEEFSVMGYDAMRFIIEAVKATNGETKDRAKIISALEKVSYTGPRGPMSMAKNRQATQNVYIVKTVAKPDGSSGFEVIDTYKDFEHPLKGCNLN